MKRKSGHQVPPITRVHEAAVAPRVETEGGESFDGIQEIRKGLPIGAFFQLQEKVKSLPSVEEIVDQKSGITYRTTKSFSRFEFGQSYIRVLLRESVYTDPKKLVRDISSFKWGYKGEVKLNSLEDIDYVVSLIKQSYESTL